MYWEPGLWCHLGMVVIIILIKKTSNNFFLMQCYGDVLRFAQCVDRGKLSRFVRGITRIKWDRLMFVSILSIMLLSAKPHSCQIIPWMVHDCSHPCSLHGLCPIFISLSCDAALNAVSIWGSLTTELLPSDVLNHISVKITYRNLCW